MALMMSINKQPPSSSAQQLKATLIQTVEIAVWPHRSGLLPATQRVIPQLIYHYSKGLHRL
jgi:hypothetical protein